MGLLCFCIFDFILNSPILVSQLSKIRRCPPFTASSLRWYRHPIPNRLIIALWNALAMLTWAQGARRIWWRRKKLNPAWRKALFILFRHLTTGNINRATFRHPVPTRSIFWTKMVASQLIPLLYTVITPTMRHRERKGVRHISSSLPTHFFLAAWAHPLPVVHSGILRDMVFVIRSGTWRRHWQSRS